MQKKKRFLITVFVIMNASALLTVALMMLLLYIQSFVKIPYLYCVSHEVFHLYCPLCGGTRALAALLRFDFLAAIQYNVYAVYLLGIALYYDIKAGILAFRGDARAFNFPWWLMWVTLGLFFIYFVVRNALMMFWGIDPTGDLVSYWR